MNACLASPSGVGTTGYDFRVDGGPDSSQSTSFSVSYCIRSGDLGFCRGWLDVPPAIEAVGPALVVPMTLPLTVDIGARLWTPFDLPKKSCKLKMMVAAMQTLWRQRVSVVE